MVKTRQDARLDRRVGLFLVSYFVMLAVYRYSVRGTAGAYDLLWLCNMALLVAGVACLFNLPELVACTCGAVAFSHVSWNLDVILWSLDKGMPFGTASYLLWPGTSAWEIVTTLHHVWMIPLLAVALRRVGKRFVFSHMLKGMALPGVLVPLSYYVTPKTHGETYLNINMSHEFWPGSPIELMRSFDQSHNLLLAAWIVGVGTVANTLAWLAVLAVQRTLEALFGAVQKVATSKKQK
jgi:hypothetical protein